MSKADPSLLLGPRTSLGVGGPARRLVTAASPDGITEALRTHDGDPLLVLGGGTNVVLSDAGWPGTVLVVEGGSVKPTPGGLGLAADAGVDWDRLVVAAVARGLGGLEMMSGIPGSVGAAPVQNIGAYGQQVCDAIEAVEVVDRATLEPGELAAADCGFGFRDSRFKGDLADRYVVTRVRFALSDVVVEPPAPSTYGDIEAHFDREGGSPTVLADRRGAVLSVRRAKSMLLDPADPNARSAGSFFVNPTVPVAFAGELVERFRARGLRVQYLEGAVRTTTSDVQRVPAALVLRASGFNPGDSWGPVKLSDKHVLALVTRPGATATDVWNVANHVRSRAEDATGVSLSYEPTFVGEFPPFDPQGFAASYRYEPAEPAEPEWMRGGR